jgi:hypothetical protein
MMARSCFFSFLVALVLLSTQVAHASKIKELDQRTKQILSQLNAQETRQFAAIRDAHGIVQSVAYVEQRLKKAVQSCRQSHKDLVPTLDKSMQGWTQEVSPVMQQARQRLDKMIMLQNYSTPKEIRAFLRLFDQAVEERNKDIKIIPISSKGECQDLIKSLDKTKKDLPKLLIENLRLNQKLD